jgi:glucose-6-phosphate 1-epimerase
MTLDDLNRRYGAPGRMVFRTGFAGYPEVVLANKFGTAEIALMGANVLSYRPTGHSPVLFRPEKRDYNRGESLHGGLPVCWPQFGKLAIEGMSAHGFARVMLFEVRGTQYSEDMTEITLGLKSSPDTKALWPYDFDLEYKVSVSMKLNLKLTTKNTGDAPFGFTAGFHPYFLVRERDQVAVRGLDGCAYVDARDMTDHVLSGDLAMNSEADHVFTLKPAPKHEFALLDSGLRRAIAMVSTGSDNAVVWNPGPAAKLSDCAADDWRKFVCVEPVTAWPKATGTLAPGETSVLAAAIQSTVEE